MPAPPADSEHAAPRGSAPPVVYSIGHSNHALATFRDLLLQHGIRRLVDVRSQPVSKFTPYFGYPKLGDNLASAGVEYLFLGRELGGRPEGAAFYDDDGHVLYDRLARSPLFEKGLARLIELARSAPTAMMCSEEDPCICHRKLLIARVLAERGVPVVHVRGDGRTQRDDELDDPTGGGAGIPQLTLFDTVEARPWKSLRSVLPKRPPQTFSDV